MNKIGIFVEGQTERIFVIKFLSEYLGGEHNFSRLEIKNLGSKGTKIIGKRNYPEAKFFFLIFDTTGDGNVVPFLIERARNMIEQEGYHCILALEDLYARPKKKKGEVIKNFSKSISKFQFKKKLFLNLAIMEIEAWFLADPFFLKRINCLATPQYIKKELSIDLLRKNPENFDHPAEIINRIYQLFGENNKYKKTEDQIYSIVNNLDFEHLLSGKTLRKIKSWNHFFTNLKTIFDHMGYAWDTKQDVKINQHPVFIDKNWWSGGSRTRVRKYSTMVSTYLA